MASGSLLADKMVNPGPNVYYNEQFRTMIEFHLPFLRAKVSTVAAAIPGNLGLRYQNDFYGLLYEIKIKPHLHWITLRLNGMSDPSEFQLDRVRILIPDENEIDALRTTFTTLHKIT